jgi:hypothetical protein
MLGDAHIAAQLPLGHLPAVLVPQALPDVLRARTQAESARQFVIVATDTPCAVKRGFEPPPGTM